jgi:hypothetical protein
LLIDSLIKKGDLFNAERFAAITYSSLKDKKNGLDQEDEDVAFSAYNLALVILQQGGSNKLQKAEELARESLRIRTNLFGSNHHRDYKVAESSMLLAEALKQQGKGANETNELFKRSLPIWIRHEGPDGRNVASANITIGRFLLEDATNQPFEALKELMLLAKSHFEEALRIELKVHGLQAEMAADYIEVIRGILRNIDEEEKNG